MAGGSRIHNELGANLIALLKGAFRGSGCWVYTSDQRVLIEATGLTTYPDVSVVRGPVKTPPEDGDTLLNPVVVL